MTKKNQINPEEVQPGEVIIPDVFCWLIRPLKGWMKKNKVTEMSLEGVTVRLEKT